MALRLFAVLPLIALLGSPAGVRAECQSAPLAIQVLGAGGNEHAIGRADSGILVWVESRARVLVDAGGGAFLRFGQAKAATDDLDLVALTGARIDQTADLPPLLAAAAQAGRTRALAVSGPAGGRSSTGVKDLLRAWFHRKRGIYRDLKGLLTSRGDPFSLRVTAVSGRTEEPTAVLEGEGYRVSALSVGRRAEDVAYQLSTGRFRVAFGVAPSRRTDAYLSWISGADVIVVPLSAPSPPGEAQPSPDDLSREAVAFAAAVRSRYLVFTRLGAPDRLRDSALREAIYAVYEGEVLWADDLKCFEFEVELPPPDPDAPTASLPEGAGGLPGGAETETVDRDR